MQKVVKLLISEGFEQVQQTITEFEQLSAHKKPVFALQSNTIHICLPGGYKKEQDQKLFSILAKLLPEQSLNSNHRDFFEGMLMAIGVEDLEPIVQVIRKFGKGPFSDRQSALRQLMVQDQIRYVETMLKLKTVKAFQEQFFTNPQGKKGQKRLEQIQEVHPGVEIDFSIICPLYTSMKFETKQDGYRIIGYRWVEPKCIGCSIEFT